VCCDKSVHFGWNIVKIFKFLLEFAVQIFMKVFIFCLGAIAVMVLTSIVYKALGL